MCLQRRAKASQHGKMSAESSQTEGGEEEEEEEEGGAKDDDESESDNPDKPWCLCAKPHDNRCVVISPGSFANWSCRIL